MNVRRCKGIDSLVSGSFHRDFTVVIDGYGKVEEVNGFCRGVNIQ